MSRYKHCSTICSKGAQGPACRHSMLLDVILEVRMAPGRGRQDRWQSRSLFSWVPW